MGKHVKMHFTTSVIILKEDLDTLLIHIIQLHLSRGLPLHYINFLLELQEGQMVIDGHAYVLPGDFPKWLAMVMTSVVLHHAVAIQV